MSRSLGAEAQTLDDLVVETIYELVKKTAVLMLESRDATSLTEFSWFQILISTDFKWRKEGPYRGIKFDVLIETARDQVISFMLIVPCENALFDGTAPPDELLQ